MFAPGKGRGTSLPVADELLEVSIARDRKGLVIRCSGAILESNVDELRQAIGLAAESSEMRSLTIDCSGVRDAGPVAFEMLARAARVAQERAMDFGLIESPELRVLREELGFDYEEAT
jgi:anti-anti-sigma regulatory factor